METSYETIIDNINLKKHSERLSLTSIVDSDGVIHYISDEHLEVIGYNAHELQNTCVFDYIHPDDLTKLAEVEKPNEKTTTRTFRFRHKNGGWVTLKAEIESLSKNAFCRCFLVVANETINLSEILEDVEIKKLINRLKKV